jgi:hypothetical protein
MYSFPCGYPTKILTTIFVHVVISMLYMSILIGRYEPPEDYWRKSILDEELISSKKICYIASKADKMIDWKDVSSHAEEARQKGWAVREIIFEDTPHCNHISKHEEVYVNAVTNLWLHGKVDTQTGE